jgi:sulfate permease, SulP family
MNGILKRVLPFLPAIQSLQTYSLASFKRDLIAGFTVAVVAVPQAMAYAMIVGLPVQYGLYTAIIMTTVGAIFDSSRHLVNGPTNVISIATFSALAKVSNGDIVQAAILMTTMIGLIQLVIALFRMGDFSRFISHAVIVGFTAGASVLLILDQLKNILGLAAKGNADDHFLYRFYLTITQGGTIHWRTLVVSFFTIALIFGIRRFNKAKKWNIPEFLLGLVVISFVVWLLKWSQDGVGMVSKVPEGLPKFAWPQIDFATARQLTTSAIAIAFLGLLEAIAMGKALAAKSGQRLDMNQQCLSEALANCAGALFQCMPGSGSLTRSYINHQAGAATQWSAIFSAIIVAVIVYFFAPWATYIPKPALAGVLVVTAFRMIDLRGVSYYSRATKYDAIIVAVTAFAAIFISIEFCVLIGVLISFFLYIPRAAKLYLTELTVSDNRVVRELRGDEPRCGLYRIFNIEGEFFFGSSVELENAFNDIRSKLTPDIRVVLIRLKGARNPDAVCLKVIDQFVDFLIEKKITLVLSGVHEVMHKSLNNVGLVQKIGQQHLFLESADIFSSTLDAVRHIYKLLGEDRCQGCPQKQNKSINDGDLYYMI